MLPDSRSSLRFFQAVAASIASKPLSHIHLVNGSGEWPFPIELFVDQGFKGVYVAGRSSIAQAAYGLMGQIDIRLDDRPTAGEEADTILMEMPQGREAWMGAVLEALNCLRPKGCLYLFGVKEEGILTVAKRFSHVETVLYKGHMRLVMLTSQSRLLENVALNSDLGDDGFHHMNGPDGVTLASLPGTFSWREADPGSLLLLDALPAKGGATVLDWGCGNGLLGVTLAKRWPEARITMSDDSWAAVRCARRTVELNGVKDRCEVVAEDGVGEQLRAKSFDLVISNPPFHRGVRTDHEMARRFLIDAGGLLKPGGELWLVCGRFLDYGRLLAEQMPDTIEVSHTTRFSVWRGKLPEKAAVSAARRR